MKCNGLLDKIKGVEIKKPSDNVIDQFRELLMSGDLKKGDILPSERVLADRFGVGRGYVREAIKTMELYGVFKSVPGVGTVISEMGVGCIAESLHNLMRFGIHDVAELLETRLVIEPCLASQAAQMASENELQELVDLSRKMSHEVEEGRTIVSLDCDFHMRIGYVSQNRILSAIMASIMPGLMNLLQKINKASRTELERAAVGHEEIARALVDRDASLAASLVRSHVEATIACFQRNREKQNITPPVPKRGRKEANQSSTTPKQLPVINHLRLPELQ